MAILFTRNDERPRCRGTIAGDSPLFPAAEMQSLTSPAPYPITCIFHAWASGGANPLSHSCVGSVDVRTYTGENVYIRAVAEVRLLPGEPTREE